MNSEILDLSPLAPPVLSRRALGRSVDFAEIVSAAGMRNVVTGMRPEIRIYPGTKDMRVPHPGKPIYCIAGATLPTERKARAREVLRRLAYAFHDYPAREVVARYHRDIKRLSGANLEGAARTALRGTSQRVRRALQAAGEEGLSVSELATQVAMAQPNVSRTLAAMEREQLVEHTRSGRSVRYRLNPRRLEEVQKGAFAL